MFLVSLGKDLVVKETVGSEPETFHGGTFEEVVPSSVAWGRAFRLTAIQKRKRREEERAEQRPASPPQPTRKNGKKGKRHRNSDNDQRWQKPVGNLTEKNIIANN